MNAKLLPKIGIRPTIDNRRLGVRESLEEAGVPFDAVAPHYSYVIDRGGWSYTTIIAEVTSPFEPEITDAESHALEWVALDQVEDAQAGHRPDDGAIRAISWVLWCSWRAPRATSSTVRRSTSTAA